MRTIGSTIVGEAVDSLIFYPLAFYGVWTHGACCFTVMRDATTSLKVGWEVRSTRRSPTASWRFLKRAEHEDYFDRDTNFTPFSLEM